MARPAQVRLASSFIAAVAAVALVLPAAVARGDQPAARPPSAEKWFADGRDAANRGDYQVACNAFHQSYVLDPAVGTLINLGDCEEHLGHPEIALANYERAFASLSVTDDRLPLVRSRIDGVERRSGRLELRLADTAPRDAKVSVDGQVVESSRLATVVLVPPGTHFIVVTSIGFRGSRQRVSIREGETRTIRLWPGPPLAVAAPSDVPSDETVAADESRRKAFRVVGYTLGAVGIASLWVGSVTGLFAIDRAAIRSSNCNGDLCNPTGYDAARNAKTLATVSTVTLAGGVAAVVGGLVLVLTNRPRATAPQTSLDFRPAPGGGVLGLERTF